MIISLQFISCQGQTSTQKYIDTIHTICKDADIIEIEETKQYTEIDYLCNDKIFEVAFDDENNILFIETKVQQSEMPMDKIDRKLEKKYPGWLIDECSFVETPDTSYYKVEIIHNGIEQNLYFTLEGKYYKANHTFASTTNDEKIHKTYVSEKSYNLSKPNVIYEMPDILTEISGIAIIDSNNIFCIQDEDGMVFQYNIKDMDVAKVFRFTDVGDFEDVAMHNDTAYILRSDGTIFYFNYRSKTRTVHSVITSVNSMNIEGLDYDTVSRELYVACKEPSFGADQSKRFIYVLSPGTFEVKRTIAIRNTDIRDAFSNRYPSLTNNPAIQCNPSAIAIHPLTRELYVLSASDRLLVVYNNDTIREIYPLPSDLFYKPEGISFTSNGDMFISTEGMKKGYMNGRIYMFVAQKHGNSMQ
jgi:DNA-binding beta-propeller fold protein YncE